MGAPSQNFPLGQPGAGRPMPSQPTQPGFPSMPQSQAPMSAFTLFPTSGPIADALGGYFPTLDATNGRVNNLIALITGASPMVNVYDKSPTGLDFIFGEPTPLGGAERPLPLDAITSLNSGGGLF